MEAADNAAAGTGVSETDGATGSVGVTTILVGIGDGDGTVGVMTTTDGTMDTVGVTAPVGSAGATTGAWVKATGIRVAVPTMMGVVPTGWVAGTNVAVGLSFSCRVGAGLGVRVGTVPPCRPALGPDDAQAAVP
jgi:hypothetical protein